jgi:acyl dehydratase
MRLTQVYWEDVEIGQEITTLVKRPTPTQVMMWAGAVDDYNRIHAEGGAVNRAGYSKSIVFGPLICAFLRQMLTSWMGVDGWLRKITVRHNAPAYVNEDIVCKGRISAKYIKDVDHYIDLSIQAGHGGTEEGTVGSATVILPLKATAPGVPATEPMPEIGWLQIED